LIILQSDAKRVEKKHDNVLDTYLIN